MYLYLNRYNNPLKILIGFCKNPQKYCPTKAKIPINGEVLFMLITKNKLGWILKHFLFCKKCKKHLSGEFLNQIQKVQVSDMVFSSLYNKEIYFVLNFLRKEKMQACFFKTLSNKSGFFGSDIDILVSKDSFKKVVNKLTKLGYKKSRLGKLKECQLKSPTTGIELDLHFLLAYPHYGELNNKNYVSVVNLTSDVINSNAKKNRLILYPDIEHLLLIKSMRFFLNDLLTGLGALYSIAAFFIEHKDEIDWKGFLKLTEKYGFTHECLFTLLLCKRIFQTNLPTIIDKKLTLPIRIAAMLYTNIDIALFPPIAKWNYPIYSREVSKKMLKFTLTKYLLSF